MYKLFDWKNEINENELNEVVQTLENDGIVIFPTETVYGIGGKATSDKVVDRVYQAKRRPRAKAVNVLVANRNEIEKYAEITSDIERKIINAFMPGPLTIILKKKAGFGDYFTAENDTIGVRIPDNRIINAILDRVPFPLIAPSANISDEPSGIRAQDIAEDFKDTVDIIIDGGDAKIGTSSTIVKVVDGEIEILRAGTITKEDILAKISE